MPSAGQREHGTTSEDRRHSARRAAVAVGVAVLSASVYFFVPGFWAFMQRSIFDQSPLQVNVREAFDVDPTADPINPNFIVPRYWRALGALPRAINGMYHWAYRLGGADAGASYAQIEVRGRFEEPIVLDGIRVKVLRRRQPLSGTYVGFAGGDLVDIRYVRVDLDTRPPTITNGSGFIKGKGEWSFPLQVSRTDLEVFSIVATTDKCDCSWVAKLNYHLGNESGTITIDRNGHPFRTTATNRAKWFCPWYQGGTSFGFFKHPHIVKTDCGRAGSK